MRHLLKHGMSCGPPGHYGSPEDAAATVADHAFFQYERTLQREANPELCIYLPAPDQAQEQEGTPPPTGTTPAPAGGQGRERSSGAASGPAGGGGSSKGEVQAVGLDGPSGVASMELDEPSALPGSVLQTGGTQASGSAGEQQDGNVAARHDKAGAARAGKGSSKGSGAVQNGSGVSGPAVSAPAEGGMRTVLIRIDYSLERPTSGLTFWGAYAHTDNQVERTAMACSGCDAQKGPCDVLPVAHSNLHALVAPVNVASGAHFSRKACHGCSTPLAAGAAACVWIPTHSNLLESIC